MPRELHVHEVYKLGLASICCIMCVTVSVSCMSHATWAQSWPLLLWLQVLGEETQGEAIISTGVGQHQMWAAQVRARVDRAGRGGREGRQVDGGRWRCWSKDVQASTARADAHAHGTLEAPEGPCQGAAV